MDLEDFEVVLNILDGYVGKIFVLGRIRGQ
jgi:hypothetical protein